MNLKLLQRILQEEQLTCVIASQGKLYRETSRGIRPLLHFLATDKLQDALIADRIIGKAAAMLMIYGGVREIYTHTISTHALAILRQYNIPLRYEQEVPYIINRTKDGMCPMEACILTCNDPQTAYCLLKAKVAQLQIENAR